VEKDWETWQKDSLDWFLSDSRHTGSFLWVCEILGTEPDKLREWVRGLRGLDRKERKATILSLIRLTYLRGGASLRK
jgi:hypothetical protein